VRNYSYGALLVYLKMPLMTGKELYLRMEQKRPEMPIRSSSSGGIPEIETDYYIVMAGRLSLHKPFALAEPVNALKEVL